MREILKISMVSYLNSKPFLFGLESTKLIRDLELHLEIPAQTAKKIKSNLVDIALVPVATLPHLEGFTIITDYCIGANERVDSVFLFSAVPIEQVMKIYLDAHSRTSANLIQILCREYWQIEVEFINDSTVNADLVKGNDACLMIGDKALECRHQMPYQYDLATAWNKHTGLPFVFAVWVSNKKGEQIEESLNQSLKIGVDQLNHVSDIYAQQFPNLNVAEYFTQSIDYHYNKEKAKALDLFLKKMKANRFQISIP